MVIQVIDTPLKASGVQYMSRSGEYRMTGPRSIWVLCQGLNRVEDSPGPPTVLGVTLVDAQMDIITVRMEQGIERSNAGP